MELIFTPEDSGTKRASGYATVPYSSDAEDETVVETTKSELAAIFEAAKSDGKTLSSVDEGIGAAVEDPLPYRDFLILKNGEIVFDEGYTRSNE
ncbi:uncharacterized protein Nmag_4283 (plasmid) [Natrialba magadii ATCC 43099]|uniref:Uncharacterized protein n=2 Tax=root TaxID=1 RepID=D3T2I2_NATMM|nr:hypothetical protein [Natrialba magadii]YP_010078065.1 uncharacterized protein KMC42_gp35 [Natrialba phage PhiCh1]ADD07791.1 uncharacterized protein Nmag_4283 [Natrialba magadii ATCC 43099]ELY23040.1 hypothetical protein C500_21290 [Natrialba magadii ATCC 43099]QBJ01216.1 uncharacterized protein PhiCh1_170 [Natrialba phage PhiCh1]